MVEGQRGARQRGVETAAQDRQRRYAKRPCEILVARWN